MPEQRTSIHGRLVALIDAPSNLGWRPPADGAFPIFDPDLDEDGELAAKLTGSLCRAFAAATAIASPR